MHISEGTSLHECKQFRMSEEEEPYPPADYPNAVLRGERGGFLRSVEIEGQWQWVTDPRAEYTKPPVTDEVLARVKLAHTSLEERLSEFGQWTTDDLVQPYRLVRRDVRDVLNRNRSIPTVTSHGRYDTINRQYAGFSVMASGDDRVFETFEASEEGDVMISRDGHSTNWFILSAEFATALEGVQAKFAAYESAASQLREEQEREELRATQLQMRRDAAVGGSPLEVDPTGTDYKLWLQAELKTTGIDFADLSLKFGGPLVALRTDGDEAGCFDFSASGDPNSGHCASIRCDHMQAAAIDPRVSAKGSQVPVPAIHLASDDPQNPYKKVATQGVATLRVLLDTKFYPLVKDTAEGEDAKWVVNVDTRYQLNALKCCGSVTSGGGVCLAHAGTGRMQLSNALEEGAGVMKVSYEDSIGIPFDALSFHDMHLVLEHADGNCVRVESRPVQTLHGITVREAAQFFPFYASCCVKTRERWVYPNAPNLMKTFTATGAGYGPLHALMQTNTGLSDEQLEHFLKLATCMVFETGSGEFADISDMDATDKNEARQRAEEFKNACSENKISLEQMKRYRHHAARAIHICVRIGSDYHLDGCVYSTPGTECKLSFAMVDSFLSSAPRNILLESNDCDGSALLVGQFARQLGIAPFHPREIDSTLYPYSAAIRNALRTDVFAYAIVGATGAQGSEATLMKNFTSSSVAPAQGHATTQFIPIGGLVEALARGASLSASLPADERRKRWIQYRRDEFRFIDHQEESSLQDDFSLTPTHWYDHTVFTEGERVGEYADVSTEDPNEDADSGRDIQPADERILDRAQKMCTKCDNDVVLAVAALTTQLLTSEPSASALYNAEEVLHQSILNQMACNQALKAIQSGGASTASAVHPHKLSTMNETLLIPSCPKAWMHGTVGAGERWVTSWINLVYANTTRTEEMPPALLSTMLKIDLSDANMLATMWSDIHKQLGRARQDLTREPANDLTRKRWHRNWLLLRPPRQGNARGLMGDNSTSTEPFDELRYRKECYSSLLPEETRRAAFLAEDQTHLESDLNLRRYQESSQMRWLVLDGTVDAMLDISVTGDARRTRREAQIKRQRLAETLGSIPGSPTVDLPATGPGISGHMFYMHWVELTIPGGPGVSSELRKMGVGAYTYLCTPHSSEGPTLDKQVTVGVTPYDMDNGKYQLVPAFSLDEDEGRKLDVVSYEASLQTVARRPYGALATSISKEQQQASSIATETFNALKATLDDKRGGKAWSPSNSDLVITISPRTFYNSPGALNRLASKLQHAASNGADCNLYIHDVNDLDNSEQQSAKGLALAPAATAVVVRIRK